MHEILVFDQITPLSSDPIGYKMGRDLVALLSKRNATQRGGSTQQAQAAASASSGGKGASAASASSSGAPGSRQQQKVGGSPDGAKAKLLSIYGPKKRNSETAKNKSATDNSGDTEPKAKAKTKAARKSKAKPSPKPQVPVESPEQDQVSKKGMKRPAAAAEHSPEDDALDGESLDSDEDSEDSKDYPPKFLSWLCIIIIVFCSHESEKYECMS